MTQGAGVNAGMNAQPAGADGNAQLANDGIDSVPLEVMELITTQRLPAAALRSLSGACRSFGPQPTSNFLTRLFLSLADVDCLRRPLLNHRMSHVQSLTVGGTVTASGVEQMQLVALLSSHAPHMPLTKFCLHITPLSTVVSAAACLRSACPLLSHVELHDIVGDSANRSLAPAPALPHLWTALSHLPLQRLAVCGLAQGPPGTGLPGLGALAQLQRLSLGHQALRLADMSQLVSLIEVTLAYTTALPPPAQHAAPVLHGPTKLRRLALLDVTDATATLQAFAACPGLTILLVTTSGLSPLVSTWTLLQPSFSGMVRLTLNEKELVVTCAQLQAMPSLRELHCSVVQLPPAEDRVHLPQVLTLEGVDLFSAVDAAGGPADGQPLAQTFPQLRALMWEGWDPEKVSPPPEELLPATPAGRFEHLRQLGTSRVHHFMGVGPFCVEELVATWMYHEFCPVGACVRGLAEVGHRLRRVEWVECRVGVPNLTMLCGLVPNVEDWTFIMFDPPDPRNDLMEDMRTRHGDESDAYLVTLARLQRRLRRVSLVGCRDVTPAGVAALAGSWSVERIEVCDCARVGPVDVRRILSQHGRPQLDVVHAMVERPAQPWGGGPDEETDA